jgi:hypothetical protein
MAITTEESSLETRIEQTTELAPVASAAAFEAEIKAAITVALRFPRNEDRAFEKLMKACRRTAFAEEANYSFPRGENEISGPSINLAREAARVWGNIRHGVGIVADDEDSRTIGAFAWDLETNTKITAEDTFRKLIYRKKGGKGFWMVPDERDLRELTNRRAAILKRNCILEALPKDLIEDARLMAAQTLKAGVEKDPEAARKRIIIKFSAINVSTEMLEEKLGHSLASASPDELATLTQVYKSIMDGNSSWAEYIAGVPEKEKPSGPEKATLSVEDLKPAAEENRGHGDERLDAVPKKENTPENQVVLMCERKKIPDEALMTKLGQMGIEQKKEIQQKHMKELIEWVTTWQAPGKKPAPVQKDLAKADYDDSK